jgi:sec-independent protein translocase protein TatA
MSMLALFGSFGGQEILIILVLVLLLFGAKRLPELARSLGQGIKEFRKSVKEISEDTESEDPGSGRKSS